MKLTPQDIHHKEFKRGIRGYSEEEVDVFLDNVYEEFEKLYKKTHSQDDDLHKLKEKLKTYQDMELTLQNTLLTAQKSAEEVQLNAQKEADNVLNNAKKEAKRLLTGADKQKQVVSETLTKLKSLESSFKTKIRSSLEELLRKMDKIDTEEDTILEEIEKEFASIPETEMPQVEKTPPVQVQASKVDTTKNEKASEKTDDNPETTEEEVAAEDKADATKSDIASEEEIDKFLEQEHPELENVDGNGENKGGLLGRVFKKKEQKAQEQDEPIEVIEEVVEDAANEKLAKKEKKKKKKKAKKKNTEEIKV